MSRAKEILAKHHTAGQVRRAAQKACAGMARDHRKNKDTYFFTDNSRIVVIGNTVRLEYAMGFWA